MIHSRYRTLGRASHERLAHEQLCHEQRGGHERLARARRVIRSAFEDQTRVRRTRERSLLFALAVLSTPGRAGPRPRPEGTRERGGSGRGT